MTKKEVYILASKIGEVIGRKMPILHVSQMSGDPLPYKVKFSFKRDYFEQVVPGFVKHEYNYPEIDKIKPFTKEELQKWFNGLGKSEQVGYFTSALYAELGKGNFVIGEMGDFSLEEMDGDHAGEPIVCMFIIIDYNWDEEDKYSEWARSYNGAIIPHELEGVKS